MKNGEEKIIVNEACCSFAVAAGDVQMLADIIEKMEAID